MREIAPALPVGARLARMGPAFALVAMLASGGGAQAREADDPFESVNRAVFRLNLLADAWVLEPAARTYRAVAPELMRQSVANFLHNLRAPVVLANDILQGEAERAGTTLCRFAINSTLGVFGLFDPAVRMGYHPHHEDLGQTLGAYGVTDGPYLVLPILGPSNARDTVGRVGDYLLLSGYLDADALTALFGATTVSEREANLEAFEALSAGSLDLYAMVRSAYGQQRAAEIRNGRAAIAQEESYDDIFRDPESE